MLSTPMQGESEVASAIMASDQEEKRSSRAYGDISRAVTSRDMSTASTPSSPGHPQPSTFRSVSPEPRKEPEIEPPERPRSTPFPSHDDDDSMLQAIRRPGDLESQLALGDAKELLKHSATIEFDGLPTEIHELIIDHLFGVRASTLPSATTSRGWSTALRHSRRRQLCDLALVNKQYRLLVQGRLFKHIKVKGTRPSIAEAIEFFIENRHLQQHPRHIEIWSPVWERRTGPAFEQIIFAPTTPERSTLTRTFDGAPGGFESSSNLTAAYQLSSRNSTLYEIFHFVSMVFPNACVLTLEGGHCKKPPMIKHFQEQGSTDLPQLSTIRTLILKSAWNIMRTEEDFTTIMNALPRLEEWQSSYAKAKSKSYLNISNVVSKLPPSVKYVNLSLEANYSRELHSPRFWRKIYPDQSHICTEMAKALPQMERFTYCGRICHQFFAHVTKNLDSNARGNHKVRSIDLTVKNCCRARDVLDGTGITDSAFIAALEILIVAAIKSLEHLIMVDFLRVRFVDLESPMPLLNPFFQLKGNEATGLWSDKILAALARSRPAAVFPELSDDFGGIKYDKEFKLIPGETFPRGRPLSLKVSSYSSLHNEIVIT